MVDVVKNLKINDDGYYESNSATTSDEQGDLTRNPDTFTCTNNGNETVTHTSNRYFEQTILGNQTILVVSPTMNPRIYQGIASILFLPQTLLTPATNEVVTDAASGGAWVNRTPRQVR